MPVKTSKASSAVARGKESNADAYESRALAKGLGILEYLASSRKPLSLADLSNHSGLGKASTLRLLRTLEATGYLVRMGNEKYGMESSWPSAQTQMMLRALRSAASPIMRELGSKLGETVAMAFLFDDHIRVVEVLESSQHIRMSNYSGRVLQPYASSLGKAITAFQSAERVQKLLDVYGVYPLTPNTITNRTAIYEEFSLVRQQGYAVDREETVEGGICFGAPIFWAPDEVIAAVSVSSPKVRVSEAQEEVLSRLVRQAAACISSSFQAAGASGENGDAESAV